MSQEDFAGKLYARYGGEGPQNPTPKQIQSHITQQGLRVNLQAQFGDLDPAVIALITTRNVGVFLSWLSYYTEELGPDVTSALTPDCIRHSGHIHEKKLRRAIRAHRRGNGSKP